MKLFWRNEKIMNGTASRSLKELSLEAKRRLKKGFWTEIGREKQNVNSSNTDDVNLYFDSKIMKSIKKEGEAEADRMFEERVREIVENEENISNPITLLIDDTIVERLDYNSRQRYLMSISERYNRVREEILRDKKLLEAIQGK